jgi:hypothetical protein
VFDARALTWWNVVTGGPANPTPARFAVQPAGLSHLRSTESISPNCDWRARGYERHRGFGDLGWDNRGMEFGAFVEVMHVPRAKTWIWRVGESSNAPAVAFSPNGATLAGALRESSGGSILIWAVPR